MFSMVSLSVCNTSPQNVHLCLCLAFTFVCLWDSGQASRQTDGQELTPTQRSAENRSSPSVCLYLLGGDFLFAVIIEEDSSSKNSLGHSCTVCWRLVCLCVCPARLKSKAAQVWCSTTVQARTCGSVTHSLLFCFVLFVMWILNMSLKLKRFFLNDALFWWFLMRGQN